MLMTATGGDVADLLDRLESMQSVIADVHDAIERNVTYQGWLSVDVSAPPGT